MNNEGNDFGGQTGFDSFTRVACDGISAEVTLGMNRDNFTDIPVFDPLGDEMELSGPNISFGATPSELQVAANIAQMAEWAGDSLFGKICGNVVDSIGTRCRFPCLEWSHSRRSRSGYHPRIQH